MTLTYFTARSNFVTLDKVKKVDFSETIAASDLKARRSRHLIEYMKICSIEGQGHSLTLAQGCVHTKNWIFFRNYCADLNQILYESFQVQGNENLMK